MTEGTRTPAQENIQEALDLRFQFTIPDKAILNRVEEIAFRVAEQSDQITKLWDAVQALSDNAYAAEPECTACGGTGHTRAECVGRGSAEAAPKPPALDPVLVAIKALYELIDEDHVIATDLRNEWRTRHNCEEANILVVDAAIRAYGADAREGGK